MTAEKPARSRAAVDQVGQMAHMDQMVHAAARKAARSAAAVTVMDQMVHIVPVWNNQQRANSNRNPSTLAA
jgi:hypothetical protein